MLVSVIIPALNEADNVRRCVLDAQRGYDPSEVEIIVVDGGSADRTRQLVPPAARLIHAPRGRARQMNAGAAESRGEILVFCHADSFLPEGWREAVVKALDDPRVSGGTFQTRIVPARGILRWRNRWRFGAHWPFMFGDQVQFMRRATFVSVGGFADIPLMEDVEMSRSLHTLGRLIRIDRRYRVSTSSRRFLERGVMRQIWNNAGNLFHYLVLGRGPAQIAARYHSSREKTGADQAKRRLIVFAKWPQPGATKTRLGADVGHQAAAGVYARLLFSYLVELAHAELGAEVVLSLADSADLPYFREAFPEWRVVAQEGDDLGARMWHALRRAFADGCTSAVLTGSDVPGLGATVVREAFAALQDASVVVAPATDGGYCLVGMRAPGADLFSQMTWSDATVYETTLAKAAALDLSVAELPAMRDLDDKHDLDDWRGRLCYAPNTTATEGD